MNTEQEFYTYLMQLICQQGGTRLQMASSDITTELQKLPPKHPVNLHRKQYGNIASCLKECKFKFFTYSDNIVKLLPKEQMDKISQHVPLWDLYCETHAKCEEKMIQVMIINKQNKCSNCGEIYKEIINKPGMCNNGQHIPLY